jgi:hypothetical protein
MIAAEHIAEPGQAASGLRLGRVALDVRIGDGIADDWPAQWADAERFRRECAAIFEEMLASLLDDADPSVWIVRRLDLAAFVDGGGRAGAAAGLARALRAAIARALHGEDGGGVLRFPTRAAYLALLLGDVARGVAHERWYHFRHRHLQPLPVADALARILAAHAEHVPAALAGMHASDGLADLAAALGERGAARAMATICRAAGPVPAAAGTEAILAPEAVAAAVRRWGFGARARLALFAATAERSGLPAAELAAAAERAVAAASWRDGPARAGRAGTAPGRRLGPSRRQRRPERPAPDRGAEPGPRQAPPAPRPAPAPALGPHPIETRFAGTFLLWRSVVALGLDRLLPPGPRGGRARLTLAAALAGRDWREAFADPALHWLAGFAPGDKRAAVPGPELGAAFAQRMADHFAPRPLRLVEQRRGPIRVVQDAVSEDWIHLCGPRRLGAQATGLPAAVPVAAAGVRPVGRDLDFFGISGSSGGGRLVWALLARAAFGDLGRRLLGLERSSASYLAANLAAGAGRVDFAAIPEVTLPRAPLDLLLRMTGMDGATVRPRDGPAFRLRLPGAG